LADQANQVDKSPFAFAWNNPVLLNDPSGLAPETIYRNNTTGEEVEVKDGIDKTIEVNETDFKRAKDFASINKNESKSDVGGDEWTQENQQDYYEFYQSVNSYDEVSLANILDYFIGGPDDGVYEISIGGPAGKTGGSIVANSMGKVPRVRSSKLRRLWEKFTGKKWPKEPKNLPDGSKNPYSGRNQSVSHKKALQDGGTNDVSNLEPEPWKIHHQRHMDNGDFKRWGKNRKKKKKK